jgi:hypothetical protein
MDGFPFFGKLVIGTRQETVSSIGATYTSSTRVAQKQQEKAFRASAFNTYLHFVII